MAWWLVDSIINGTLDEDYPIMKKSEKDVTIVGGGGTDTIEIKGSGDTISFGDPAWWGEDGISLTGNPTASPDTIVFGGSRVPGGMGNDHISFGNLVDDVYSYHFPGTDTKPKPNLKGPSVRKYQEDKSMEDLSDYVSSTYQGHYTNDNSDVQTLDLIHSVGDAESFCRANAIKYLSRYDKKGTAKRDILKAMHYCLLLYYFSGNTQNEITTRGYETF